MRKHEVIILNFLVIRAIINFSISELYLYPNTQNSCSKSSTAYPSTIRATIPFCAMEILVKCELPFRRYQI